VAAERGWSEAELGDRSIPTAGFGPDGLLHLSYGEREFLGRLTPELTIALTDADGRARKSLPAARKSEDGQLLGADDAVLGLSPDAVVTLAHGTLLSEAEMADRQAGGPAR